MSKIMIVDGSACPLPCAIGEDKRDTLVGMVFDAELSLHYMSSVDECHQVATVSKAEANRVLKDQYFTGNLEFFEGEYSVLEA